MKVWYVIFTRDITDDINVVDDIKLFKTKEALAEWYKAATRKHAQYVWDKWLGDERKKYYDNDFEHYYSELYDDWENDEEFVWGVTELE